jgi:hypothetical protein
LCLLAHKLNCRCNLGKLAKGPFAADQVNQVMMGARAGWVRMRSFGSRNSAALAEFDKQLVSRGQTASN